MLSKVNISAKMELIDGIIDHLLIDTTLEEYLRGHPEIWMFTPTKVLRGEIDADGIKFPIDQVVNVGKTALVNAEAFPPTRLEDLKQRYPRCTRIPEVERGWTVYRLRNGEFLARSPDSLYEIFTLE